MGRAGRGGDRGGEEGRPAVEGEAVERVTQCQVFTQAAPAEQLRFTLTAQPSNALAQ